MPSIRRWLRRTKIKVVYPDDLKSVLEQTGLLSALNGGTLTCYHCGRSLEFGDIACLMRTSDGFVAICSKLPCCRPQISEEGDGTDE